MVAVWLWVIAGVVALLALVILYGPWALAIGLVAWIGGLAIGELLPGPDDPDSPLR